MAFLRLSIARRALVSFGLFALRQVAEVRATGQHTENVSLPSTRYLGEIRDYILSTRVLSLRMALNREPEVLKPTVERLHLVEGWLDDALELQERVVRFRL